LPKKQPLGCRTGSVIANRSTEFCRKADTTTVRRPNLNVAKVGGLQRIDIEGEAVAGYCDPLITQDLKSSVFPRCFQGIQQGKINPILLIHKFGYPQSVALYTILSIITVH